MMIFGKILALFLLYSVGGAHQPMPCFGENYLPNEEISHALAWSMLSHPDAARSVEKRFPYDKEINHCLDQKLASCAVGLENDYIMKKYNHTGHGLVHRYVQNQEIIALIKAGKVTQVNQLLDQRKKILLEKKQNCEIYIQEDQNQIRQLNDNRARLEGLREHLSRASNKDEYYRLRHYMFRFETQNEYILSEETDRTVRKENLKYLNEEFDAVTKVMVNLEVFNNPSRALDEMQKLHDQQRKMLDKQEFTSLDHRVVYLRKKLKK